MFDTVKLKAENIVVNPHLLEAINSKVTTYLDRETGSITDVYAFSTQQIPYVRYTTNTLKLEVELSVPKFLYGENVTLLTMKDIDAFFTLLNRHLQMVLGVDIDKSEWKVKRVDVCWNFQTGNKVQDYLFKLSLMKFPRRNTIVYNQTESVIWSNNSSRVTFYDKEKECRDKNCTLQMIKRAKGILRMEITASEHELKSYNSDKRAVHLLTKEFFIFITRKFSPYLVFRDNPVITMEWLLSLKNIQEAETVIGFNTLVNTFGLSPLKDFYSQGTLASRLKMMTKTPASMDLPPLEIAYSAIS